MARSNETALLLQQIQIVISSIYDLMQRGEDSRRSAAVPPGMPGRGPQQWSQPMSIPALMGQAGQGRALSSLSMSPWAMASVFGPRGGGQGAQYPTGGLGGGGPGGGGGRSDLFSKLLEVLNKLDQRLSRDDPNSGGGGTSGKSSRRPSPRFASEKDKWEFDEAQKRASDYVSRKRQQYFDQKQTESGRGLRVVSQGVASIGRAAGMMNPILGGALTGSLEGTSGGRGTAGALGGAGSQISSMGDALMKSGGKAAIVGLAMKAVGGAMQIPQFATRFSDAVSAGHMKYAEVSPGMAVTQAWSEVRKLHFDQKFGNQLAPFAMEHERVRDEVRERTKEADLELEKTKSTLAITGQLWWRDMHDVFGGKLPASAAFARMTGIPAAIEARRRTDEAERKAATSVSGPDREYKPGEIIIGSDDIRAIGEAWWGEKYGRPPHWEKNP